MNSNGLQELRELAAQQPLTPTCDLFYFLRHGQTNCNARRVFQAPDEPLSDLGLTQVARAAQLLAHEHLRSIVCSDMRRALDTAITVAAAAGHGITPEVELGLRERNFSALIGTSSINIDWAGAPPGGETLEPFITRTRTAVQAALAKPAPVLMVAHGGTLYALAALLGVPIDATLLGNAQPLRFERRGGKWAVRSLLPRTEGTEVGAALA